MYVSTGKEYRSQQAVAGAVVSQAPYRGPGHSVETIQSIVNVSRRDPKYRAMAEDVCRGLYGKDYLSEAAAIYHAACRGIRYFRDPATVEMIKDGEVLSKTRNGDCLPEGTLLYTPAGFVPIELIKPGDTIMGDGNWTKVAAWWDKGILDLRAFKLSTGGTFRCTDDHKLFVVPVTGDTSGTRSEAIEVAASDVEIGDHLLTPERLPFGRESLGADRAWLLGVFAADGWTDKFRVSIAGKDGHPKEAQKLRVKEICAKLGAETTWNARYITIRKNADLVTFLSACGRGAINKHIPSLDLDEESVRGVLEGLQADSTLQRSGTRTYGTISRILALQLRIMHRMLGFGTSIRRIDEHGGLGTNPIYRIGVRRPVQANGRRGWSYAVVHEIDDVISAPCYDIATESGRIYLPEHDIVVHNCDDSAALIATLLGQIGITEVQLVTVGFAPNQISHVFVRFKDPRGSGRWIVLDPVAGPTTATMLRRVRSFQVYGGV